MPLYLPAGFAFSQASLQAYLECPYRFRLRYIEQVPWPALPDPDSAAVREQGRRFHELARQAALGLEMTPVARAAGEPLARWWEALQTCPPDLSAYPQRHPEADLSVPLGAYRLMARYDLLALGPAGALVVDWKTGRSLPVRSVLADAIQTRLYLYVLAEGNGAYRGGRPLPADALGLLYWHPQDSPVAFDYDRSRQEQDGAFLRGLVDEIAGRPPETMSPTEDAPPCGRCGYAPFCGRPGGLTEEWDPEEEIEEPFGVEAEDLFLR